MSLKILQSGINPLGQYDGLDSIVTTTKGGEVVSFTYVALTGTDQKAQDVADGYVRATLQSRPAVTTSLTVGMRPLFLCDDGTAGYGTLFGTLVGGTVGQSVSGTVIGPHTAAGSGKLTLWDKPGLYAVTLDAVDTAVTTGLLPSNTSIQGGQALYATSAGLLTPNISNSFESIVVGRFIEFTGTGSLVRTPSNLVSALNSPSIATGGVQSSTLYPLDRAVFHFSPGI